jgi:outer membrane receptor protein involved in Fe transport
MVPGRAGALSVALLLWVAPAFALDGKLVRNGQPVADAEVSILGESGVARSRADGTFHLPGSPRPPFEVLVTLPGGIQARPIITTALPDSGSLLLEVQVEFEESVTVTAGSASHISSTPAAGTTLVSSRDLQVRAPAILAQALENVAGVSVVSEGHAAVPAVRGFASGRALILIDGARVTAERRVGPSASYLDPVVLESVEVARGPGGVAYGSDAFGGVIDARTRGAAPGSGFGGRFVGALGAGIPERRTSLELRHGHNSGGVLAQARWREFDDYTSPQGEVFNSGARDHGFRARVDQRVGAGYLRFGWQSDLGRDIERARNNSRAVRFYYPSEDSHRFTASWEGYDVGSWSRVGASAFFDSYAVVTDQDRFPTATTARSIERADVSSKDMHLRGFAGRPIGQARLEAGFDVNGRLGLHALDVRIAYNPAGTIASDTTFVSVDDARRLDTGVYAMLSGSPARSLELSGGLRADRVTTRNDGGFFGDRSTSNGALSGFAAATLGPFGGLRLTGQVARGYRDPVLSDRYFRGPTGRGFITGEPGLDPETSLQFDVALRYTARRFRAALLGYHYRIDDLIERYQTTTDFFFFRNRGRACMRGAELEVQAEPGAGVSLELSAHLLRGEALDDKAPLDNVPPRTLTLRATKQLGRAFFQARGAFYAEDERPGPTEQARPGYQLLELAGGFRVSDGVELRALARNLTDDEYLVSPDARATLAPGRSVLGTLTISF